MSFENISAENRNGAIMQRCCSFCRRVGHRITNCNDDRLSNFYRTCTEYIVNNGLNTFKNFLLNQAYLDPNLIKAFAIRYCSNVTTRDQIGVCINNIVHLFRNQYNNNNQIEATAIEARSPNPEPQTASESQVAEETPTASGTENINVILSRDSLLRTLFYISMIDRGRQAETLTQVGDYLLFMEMIDRINRTSEEVFGARKFNIETKISDNQENLDEKCECDICYESYEKQNFIKLNCNHEFCKDCIKKTLQNERKLIPNCAFCRSEIKNFEISNDSIREELNEFIES